VATQTGQLDTWVLAGQSNMEGFAPLSDRSAPPDDRVEVLSSAGEWTDAREPLHRIWQSYTPVHRELYRSALPPGGTPPTDDEVADAMAGDGRIGAGLGPAFASRIADVTGSRVGLIPAAHGGTTLEQWTPGYAGHDRASTSTLYGSLLGRVARARSREGVALRGVLWYQGESDATLRRSVDYGERFARWVAELRHDLALPDLPVFAVQLGRFTGLEGPELTERSWDRVRESQRTAPQRTPGLAIASAIDLELSDPIHIGATGLDRLGVRLAMLAIEGGAGPDVELVEAAGVNGVGHLVLRVRCRDVRGGWRGLPRIPGFRLCESDGTPVRRVAVVDAAVDPLDPSSILVTTSALAAGELAGVHLSYGQGFDPVCVATDERDLPLPAFAAQPVRDLT
jgi:sialate O-acetylesterase